MKNNFSKRILLPSSCPEWKSCILLYFIKFFFELFTLKRKCGKVLRSKWKNWTSKYQSSEMRKDSCDRVLLRVNFSINTFHVKDFVTSAQRGRGFRTCQTSKRDNVTTINHWIMRRTIPESRALYDLCRLFIEIKEKHHKLWRIILKQ